MQESRSEIFGTSISSVCANPKCAHAGAIDEMLSCTRCGGNVPSGIYCGVNCQREYRAQHRAECDAAKAELDKLPSKVAEFSRLMNRWAKKQMKDIMELAVSALDLCDYPENADQFEIHIFTKVPDANTVEVVDVVVGTTEVKPKVGKAKGMVQLESPGGVAALCNIWPPPTFPGCVVTGPKLLDPIKYAFTLLAVTLHNHRVNGLPCANFKERYIAKANKQAIPAKKSYTTIPAGLKRESFDQATQALEAFAKKRLPSLKAAYIERMLLAPQSDQQTALIVYVSRVAGPGLQYRVVSVANYDIKDIKLIFHDAWPKFVKAKYVKSTAEPIANDPLVFVTSLYTAYLGVTPMPIEESDIAAVSKARGPAASRPSSASAWKAPLVLELGGSELINRTQAEANERDACLNLVMAVKEFALSLEIPMGYRPVQ